LPLHSFHAQPPRRTVYPFDDVRDLMRISCVVHDIPMPGAVRRSHGSIRWQRLGVLTLGLAVHCLSSAPAVPGWNLHYHNGRPFYYNRETGESSWDPPQAQDKDQDTRLKTQGGNPGVGLTPDEQTNMGAKEAKPRAQQEGRSKGWFSWGRSSKDNRQDPRDSTDGTPWKHGETRETEPPRLEHSHGRGEVQAWNNQREGYYPSGPRPDAQPYPATSRSSTSGAEAWESYPLRELHRQGEDHSTQAAVKERGHRRTEASQQTGDNGGDRGWYGPLYPDMNKPRQPENAQEGPSWDRTVGSGVGGTVEGPWDEQGQGQSQVGLGEQVQVWGGPDSDWVSSSPQAAHTTKVIGEGEKESGGEPKGEKDAQASAEGVIGAPSTLPAEGGLEPGTGVCAQGEGESEEESKIRAPPQVGADEVTVDVG
ncbi:unnamed protein product, partial [Discosporangium mesarthrocarpum]